MPSVAEESTAGTAAAARRRSVDVGGLALALGDNLGSGQGWGGWDESERDRDLTCYAELLSDMYTHTHIAVTNHDQPSPLDIPAKTRKRLIKSLDTWNFEPHKLPDEEVLFCSVILFQTLFHLEGMQQDAGVSIDQISALLSNLRKVYRQQNSYHNFAHALDVLQATHSFLHSAGRVPPVSILLRRNRRTWKPDRGRLEKSLVSCLRNQDLLCLYIASIGHDVGHPGFTNGFMKNAKAPLSSLYDDKSPLEQMHFTLLLHLMRHQGLDALLDNPRSGAQFRKLLLEIVLATDMRVHLEFMIRFKRLVDGEVVDEWKKKLLVCQALIKCADISNPCRPLRVSQHWASALMEEWSCQAVLEQHLQLPPSVSASDNPLAEAKSQVFFIETFAKPLFLLTSSGIPESRKYAVQCESNLKLWKHRCRTLDGGDDKPSERALEPTQLPEDFLDAFPMTLPASLLRAEQDEHEHAPLDWPAPSTRASSDVSASSRAPSPAPSATSSSALPLSFAASFSAPAHLHSPPHSPLQPHHDHEHDHDHEHYASASLSTSALFKPLSATASPPTSPSDARSEISDIPPRAFGGGGSGGGTSVILPPRSLSSSSSPSPSAVTLSAFGSASASATASGSGSGLGLGGAGTAAIRAAYKASVRKKTSFHRNSWNPVPSAAALFAPPLPAAIAVGVGAGGRAEAEARS